MVRERRPPRLLSVGDVVATYCEPLGAWAAAQITHLDPAHGMASLLELDWSGSEPSQVSDLGEVAPLVMTHGAWNGEWWHVNYEWLLPRNYMILGQLPVLAPYRANAYSAVWNVGRQVAAQRRWDRGDRRQSRPGEMACTGAQFVDWPTDTSVWKLSLTDIDVLDCRQLVTRHPHLVELSLEGNFGTLVNAGALNDLRPLRILFVSELFGMTSAECLLPHAGTRLEAIGLDNVPRDYATSMRAQWRPERARGTSLEISGARDREWIAGNRDNPLRDWDTRAHISQARYKKAVLLYRDARRAVVTALGTLNGADLTARLREIGRSYAEQFNTLNGTRAPFIETVEREELLAALAHTVDAADSVPEQRRATARTLLTAVADDARAW